MNNPFEVIDARLSNIETMLLELKHGSQLRPEQPEPDQLLTIKEAAKLLNLSVPTIYGYVHRSEIPVSKRGNRLRFSKTELIDWVKASRKKTHAEIASEADQYITKKKKG